MSLISFPKAVSSEHHIIWGFIEYSDDSWVPNDIAVTITNLDDDNSIVVYTETADSGQTGAYHIDVYDLEADIDDTILINVSYGGSTGNNTAIVNDNTSQICNVTICCNLPPGAPSQPTGNSSGIHSVLYSYSTSTTDPNGDNIFYWFDWGDGTNSGWVGPYASGITINASKSWNTPGDYNIKCKAKDEHGAEPGLGWSSSLAVTIINRAPSGSSKPSGTAWGYTNVYYDFITTAIDPDGDDIFYWFDWGDDTDGGWVGPYSSGENCTGSHNWSEPGTYQIKTKVKDELELESTVGWSESFNITINETTGANIEPTASFTYSPEKPLVNTQISFTDTSVDLDGNIVNWSWDFGDNMFSNEQNPAHNYSSAGSYQVSLTVTDNENATDNVKKTISISSPSSNIIWEETTDTTLNYNEQNKGINYLTWKGEPINASDLANKISLTNGEYIEIFNKTNGEWQKYIVGSSNLDDDFKVSTWDILVIKCSSEKKIAVDTSKQGIIVQTVNISFTEDAEKSNDGYNYFVYTSNQILPIEEFVKNYGFSDENIEISVYSANDNTWNTHNPSLPAGLTASFDINTYNIICIKVSKKSAEHVLTIT